MTEHITDRAGFLAALPPEDPERRLAEEHAQSCADCREALEEGARLVSLLHRALPQTVAAKTKTPLSGPLRDIGGVEASRPSFPSPITWATPRPLTWATIGALVLAWLFQLMVGGGWDLDFDCAVVSLGILALAIASVTLSRGRKRLGVAAVVAILGTSVIFAHLTGTSAGLDPGIGIRCTFRELWAAAIAWTIVMEVGRRKHAAFGRWDVTVVAAGSALAAHAGQHLACQVPHSEAHLLIFHFGGVVVATVLGAMVAARSSASFAAR